MTYGDLYAIDHYAWMAVHPVIRLTTVMARLAETFVSLGRIVEVLDTQPDIQVRPGARPLPAGPGAVVFDRVDFAYTPDQPLFTQLSLDVPAGMTVALAGHTGCGKSTLTALLMRYWDVQGGGIRIDGRDVRELDLRSLRARFSVVPQHQTLFEGTLAENIAYGMPRATRAQIEDAARLAEAHGFAVELPNGYDTIIGSGGVQLSVGEKQRLSIARAVLRDPMILVMDDTTSALDAATEARIRETLRVAIKGRTSLVITQRVATARDCDRILVLQRGRLVQQGTHEELRAVEGFYRTVCEQQDQ